MATMAVLSRKEFVTLAGGQINARKFSYSPLFADKCFGIYLLINPCSRACKWIRPLAYSGIVISFPYYIPSHAVIDGLLYKYNKFPSPPPSISLYLYTPLAPPPLSLLAPTLPFSTPDQNVLSDPTRRVWCIRTCMEQREVAPVDC
jgi:hypothetical protein